MNEKELWQKYKKNGMGIHEKCPSNNDLAAYIEKRLTQDERDRIESHLAGCTSCLDAVMSLKQLKKSPPMPEESAAKSPFPNPAKPANTAFPTSAIPLAAASVLFVLVSYLGLSAGAGTYMSSVTATELFLEKDLGLLAKDLSSNDILDFDIGEFR